MPEYPTIMGTQQAAEYTSMGVNTIRELVASGTIPHIHVGKYAKQGRGKVLIHKADIDAYIRSSHQHNRTLPSMKRA